VELALRSTSQIMAQTMETLRLRRVRLRLFD